MIDYKDYYKYKELSDLPGEKWADIIGYEGLYQVSNMGRVKSLERYKKSRWETSDIKIHERIITIGNRSTGNYCRVKLYKEGFTKEHTIHRLVGIHFLPNPQGLPEVDHKWSDKNDNRSTSLEWVSKQENIQRSFKRGTHKPHKDWLEIGSKNPKSKGVDQFTLDGQYIRSFGSQQEAMRITGVNQRLIWGCCTGLYKKGKGFIWRYSEGYGFGRRGASNHNSDFKYSENV